MQAQTSAGEGPDHLAAVAAGTVREPFTFGLGIDEALDEHARLQVELDDAREALEELPSPDLAASEGARAARMARYSTQLARVNDASERLDALAHDIVRRVSARRDAARAVS